MTSNKYRFVLGLCSIGIVLAGGCDGDVERASTPDVEAGVVVESPPGAASDHAGAKGVRPRVDLADGAAGRIPRGGVLISLRPRKQGEEVHGWVREDGAWHGPAVPVGNYKVKAFATGKVARVQSKLRVRASGARPRLRLDVADHGRVVVRLEDKASKLPVSRAEVTLLSAECRASCDPIPAVHVRGRFVFEGLDAGQYRLNAKAPGYVGAIQKLITVSETSQVVRQELEAGTRARGTVYGPTGALSDVRVVATQDHSRNWVEAQTDGHGRFELSGLMPGEYYLVATVEGYAPYYREKWTVQPDAATPEESLRMTEGSSARGVVRDAEGGAIAGVKVMADPGGPPLGGLLLQETVTDAEGRYVFDHLVRPPYALAFRSRTMVGFQRDHTSLRDSNGAATVQLAADLGRTRLEVVDSTGAAISGAKIEVRSLSRSLFEGRTDAQGKIVLRGLEESPYELVVSHDGHATRTHALEPGQREAVRLELPRLGRVAGRVLADGGWIPEGARVVVRREGQRVSASLVDGRFDLGNIQPGEYEVSVRVFDLGGSTWQPLRVAAGAVVEDVEIRLPRVATLARG